MKKLWISSKLTHGKITWFSRNTIWGSRSFHMARSPKVWAEDIIQCSTIIVNMCFGVRISKIFIYFGFRYFLFTLGKWYLSKFQNFRVCFTLIFFRKGRVIILSLWWTPVIFCLQSFTTLNQVQSPESRLNVNWQWLPKWNL